MGGLNPSIKNLVSMCSKPAAAHDGIFCLCHVVRIKLSEFLPIFVLLRLFSFIFAYFCLFQLIFAYFRLVLSIFVYFYIAI